MLLAALSTDDVTTENARPRSDRSPGLRRRGQPRSIDHARQDVDRYISYYRPNATSHADLERDPAVFIETRNAMRALPSAALGLAPTQPALVEPRPR